MIKADMNLTLAIDTTDVKATVASFTSATDAQVLPYCVGYVPYEIVEKCSGWRSNSYCFIRSLPNTTYTCEAIQTMFEFDKGIPFAYTIRSGFENGTFHAYHDSNIDQWFPTFLGNGNNSLKLLHSFNTDYYVTNNTNWMNVNGVTLVLRMWEVIGTPGWKGQGPPYYVQKHNDRTITMNVDLLKLPRFDADPVNCFLQFSTTEASLYGTHTYTLDNNIFNNMDDRGIFKIDGGAYEEGGESYDRILFGSIEEMYLSETSAVGDRPGYGVAIWDEYRGSFNLNEANHLSYENVYGNSSYCFINRGSSRTTFIFPQNYGYYWDESIDQFNFFRLAVGSWRNWAQFGGFNWMDIGVMVLTAYPAIRLMDTINNINAWYTTEFNDNYEITGRLIPWADRREWQTFINPDDNVFDPDKIPVPSDDDQDLDPRWRGDTGPLNLNNVGVTGNFITPWVCTSGNITKFGETLWKDLFSIDPNDPDNPLAGVWENVKMAAGAYWSTGSFDPSQILNFVVGLRYYPFDLTSVSVDAGTKIFFGAGRYGVTAKSGTDNVRKLNNMCYYYGANYLDTNNNPDLQLANDWTDYDNVVATITLPFCGSFNVDWKEIAGTTLRIDWVIDFSSGIITAYVRTMQGGGNGNLIAIGSGVCGVEVPVSATNANRISAALFSDTQQAVSAITAPVTSAIQGVAMIAGGGEFGATNAAGDAEDIINTSAMAVSGGIVGGATMQAGIGLAKEAAGIIGRPGINCSLIPATKGWGSMMGAIKFAYLQVRRPRYVKPGQYKKAYGTPVWNGKQIASLSGWTECSNVDTSGLTCTVQERDMIKHILETGFYA